MGLIQVSHEKKVTHPQLLLPISTKTYVDDNGMQWEFIIPDNTQEISHIRCKKYPFIHAHAIRYYAKHRGALILNEMVMIQSYILVCGPPYSANGGSQFSGIACIIDVLARIQNNPDSSLNRISEMYRDWVHQPQSIDMRIIERFSKSYGSNIIRLYKSRDIAYKLCMENWIIQQVFEGIKFLIEQYEEFGESNG